MKSSLFSTVILLLLALATQSLSLKCNPKDRKVLFEIKEALGNPYHLASWTNDTDCCHWYVVKCDRVTSRINALTVFQANISGQIPSAVGDLPYLENLMFHHITNLTGQIPISITKLTRLKQLTLSYTNLSGPVPSFLSQLKTLTYLDLSFSNFSGSIPPELAQLTNLDALHLDRNKLTGTIPDSFGRFTGKVPEIYLSHNNLSGSVPNSLGNLNFTRIDLSRNQLVGDLSFLFGTNKAIQAIDFSRNQFAFDISKVEFPESMSNFDFNHNKVFGSLPAGLTALTNLQFFNASYNRLCGQIPQGGNLQDFTSFEYFHNRCLCGPPLPAC